MATIRKTLWILSGAAGAGKSTWANEEAQGRNAIIISRDNIRFDLMSENDSYFANETKVWRRFIDQIEYALVYSDYENIYVDATHINQKSRNKLLDAISQKVALEYVDIKVVYFNVCAAVCRQRNARRTGRRQVPDKAIMRMMNQFETPTFNEKYKYKEIWCVDASGNIVTEIDDTEE